MLPFVDCLSIDRTLFHECSNNPCIRSIYWIIMFRHMHFGYSTIAMKVSDKPEGEKMTFDTGSEFVDWIIEVSEQQATDLKNLEQGMEVCNQTLAGVVIPPDLSLVN